MNIGDKFFLFYKSRHAFSFSNIVGLNNGANYDFEYKTKWEDETRIINHSREFLENECKKVQ